MHKTRKNIRGCRAPMWDKLRDGSPSAETRLYTPRPPSSLFSPLLSVPEADWRGSLCGLHQWQPRGRDKREGRSRSLFLHTLPDTNRVPWLKVIASLKVANSTWLYPQVPVTASSLSPFGLKNGNASAGFPSSAYSVPCAFVPYSPFINKTSSNYPILSLQCVTNLDYDWESKSAGT